MSVSVSVSQIAALYEQRLTAQDRANAAVIAAKDEMIGQLRAQVEDLRQTKDRALEAQAREQALRALPAPAPQEAPQAPQAGYGSEGRGLLGPNA